jgi:surfeit locus 1 family protein
MSTTARRIAIVGLMLGAALCVRLGIWQVQRLQERRAAKEAALAARAQPPLVLGESPADTTALYDRWVEAKGVYDRDHEIVIRGQALQGAPGLHIVTPLRMEGNDSAVLVLRGFVPSPDAARADLSGLDEPGIRRVRGLAAPLGTGYGQPLDHAGSTTWARLDLAALRARLPYPLLPIVIRQTPDSSLPHSPRRIAPAEPSEGPHLGYAIQWFLFAVMAAAFAVLVVGRTPKPPTPPLTER